MKYILILLTIISLSFTAISCKSKAMTPEDFIKIETEYLDTDLSEEAKKKVVEKYGFTTKQFDEFSKKVESDEKLKQQLGEIRLKMTQGN